MVDEHSNENWRPVVGYEGWYVVSDLGRVKRVRRGPRGQRPGRILRSGPKHGYRGIMLCRGRKGLTRSFSVHRLVAGAFLGPCPSGKWVNHKNGVKDDNRAVNLEYLTPKENHAHAIEVLGYVPPNNLPHYRGEKNPSAKLTDEAVRDIRCRHGRRATSKQLASDYGVTPETVRRLLGGKTWTHVI